jgi:hypothetical protein
VGYGRSIHEALAMAGNQQDQSDQAKTIFDSSSRDTLNVIKNISTKR